MEQTTKPAAIPRDAIKDQVDEAITLCDGDARKAVRGLILGQEMIWGEIERTVSAGNVRRRLH